MLALRIGTVRWRNVNLLDLIYSVDEIHRLALEHDSPTLQHVGTLRSFEGGIDVLLHEHDSNANALGYVDERAQDPGRDHWSEA
jgi:hypothetical protein